MIVTNVNRNITAILSYCFSGIEYVLSKAQEPAYIVIVYRKDSQTGRIKVFSDVTISEIFAHLN